MKKFIIKILSLSLFFLRIALADQMNIDMYGQAHGSIDFLDDGSDSSTYISSNSSRFGFKGNLNLEDATKIIWQIECGANLDESGSTFASRNSFVGISGSMGKVFVGRHDTPFEITGGIVNLFGDRIGDRKNLIAQGGAGWDIRADNIIAYESPNWEGIDSMFFYAAEEGNEKTDILGVKVSYKNDIINFGAAYEYHGKGLTATTDENNANVFSDENESGVRVACCFKYKELKLTALVQMLQNINGISNRDRNTYGGGISYTFGEKNTIKTHFFSSDETDDLDDGGTMFAVGYDRSLANNALLYIAYAQTDNDSSASLTMSGGGHGDIVTPNVGGKTSGFSLGIIYDF